jgi:hypothetical protein
MEKTDLESNSYAGTEFPNYQHTETNNIWQ